MLGPRLSCLQSGNKHRSCQVAGDLSNKFPPPRIPSTLCLASSSPSLSGGPAPIPTPHMDNAGVFGVSRGQRTRLAGAGGGKEEEAQRGRGGRIPPREGRWMRSRRWAPDPAPLPARPPQCCSGLTQSPGSPSQSLLSLSQLAGLHSSLRPAARGPVDPSLRPGKRARAPQPRSRA